MPTIYLGRTVLTLEEFSADQCAGQVNPQATYENYLAMIQERDAFAQVLLTLAK